MKTLKHLLLSSSLLVAAGALPAQDTKPWSSRVDSLAPSSTVETSPLPQSGSSLTVAQEESASLNVNAGSNTVLTPSLKAVVLVDSIDALQRDGVSGAKGLEVRGVTPPATKLLDALLAPYWNKPLTLAEASELATKIAAHYRDNDNPLVYVVLPPMQKIANDTVQILVIEGTIGAIDAEGNAYTTLDQITRQMQQKSGDPIRTSVLESDMVWINSPTRQVDIIAGKGSKPRTADLTLKVQESKPWSVYGGFSDSGTKLTGKERWNVGATHNNLWQRDHQAGYQYSQGSDANDFFSHFVNYTLPIHRWKHTLRGFFNYSESRTRFTSGGLLSNTKGENTQLGLRYTIPVVMKQTDKRNVSFGVDYKKSDSAFDFSFFGTPLSATPTTTETVQFVAGYDHYQIFGGKDSRFPGSFSFAATAYMSPGGLSGDNDSTAYRASNANADPSYVYGKLDASRVFVLKNNWLLNFRGSAQYSPETLLGGEQFGITGEGFVRGYDPSEGTGDFGYLGSAELWTPSVSVLERLKSERLKGDRLQGLVFTDYGYAGLQKPNGADANIEAWGAGAGVRWSLKNNLSIKADYAWQLKDTAASRIFFSPDNSRAHVSMRVSW